MLMVMRLIARPPSFSKHPHALPPVTVITLSVTDDDDGARPRLNVRQRKDTGYLPHSSPFSLQFRPAILYSDGYLPLVPEDKNETDKIHTPRIVPQKLERTPSDTSRSRGCHCFYAGWL
ncbi:hypothetical protein ACLB1O_28770 [Escherichia coli]